VFCGCGSGVEDPGLCSGHVKAEVPGGNLNSDLN
jgi:hypothetical protein